jgi:Reversibly glycosylated polypeptide
LSKIEIVVTSINPPFLLVDYARQIHSHGSDDVGFILVGDVKTPNNSTAKVIHSISKLIPTCFMSVADQERWGRRYKRMMDAIPYNSDNRRNIGYLAAAERGAKIIINLDDDNYATGDDFTAFHSRVGEVCSMPVVRSSNGWFNPCSILSTRPRRRLYARGFPYSKRWKDEISFTKGTGKIMINQGLWFRDPDADAVTNLAEPVKVIRLNKEQVMLAPNTYAPLNTQNTAVHKDLLPAYYYVRMGLPIEGLKIDRYGDIWQGYFVQKLMHAQGHTITMGKPMSDHRRNKHDFMKDIKAELYGMIVTERLVAFLDSIQISSKSYADGYIELSGLIEKADLGEERGLKKYQRTLARSMRTWVETCDMIT